ncbi:DNA-binding XRE family transcriptional regulator [Paenibacillus cellulosilyticus]|uniref:DNA-binding XRE family transcriptional regulator n=1 Tax=Paenibacillus cellulosilyticus TaxID=375489 RepID=A0A2V2YHH5_9BACL|nr:helix-turn-helix transcriptional regulator [Paenibacillus cellulosilyticus]PWV92040.1 DNA-binding XRE family transcriptional regulator [Paenibacillus cellulosilyticus]QKS46722.1 helix-turn-helix transcriptional regulator [Paenibacillus cellulosilyticus]
MHSLGQKIKELRTHAHLTQMDLADRLNLKYGGVIGKSMISKWENDLEEPSLANGRNLARFFNITLDELLGLNLEIATPGPTQEDEGWSVEELEEIERFKALIRHKRSLNN